VTGTGRRARRVGKAYGKTTDELKERDKKPSVVWGKWDRPYPAHGWKRELATALIAREKGAHHRLRIGALGEVVQRKLPGRDGGGRKEKVMLHVMTKKNARSIRSPLLEGAIKRGRSRNIEPRGKEIWLLH